MDFLCTLLDMIENPGFLNIGELGCHTGCSTKTIAQWIKDKRGGNARLHVVDWFGGNPEQDHFVVKPDTDGEYKKLFRKNMAPFEDIYELKEMRSEVAVKDFSDSFFDWFWIDADHRYSMVSKDLELWYPKVKAGGIFAGHDYNSETFIEELTEYDIGVQGRPGYGFHHGVIKAVNEKFGKTSHNNLFWWIRKPNAS